MLLFNGEHPKFKNTEIDTLYKYWISKQRAQKGRLPARHHIDPLELMEISQNLIPDLWMVDVIYPGPRFRLRLIGGSLVEAGTTVRVGSYFDEFDELTRPGSISEDFQKSCLHKVPNYRIGRPQLTHSKFSSELERICLPLAANGEVVDMFLCATHYTWEVPPPPHSLPMSTAE